jgi:hypothetical protein
MSKHKMTIRVAFKKRKKTTDCWTTKFFEHPFFLFVFWVMRFLWMPYCKSIQ